MDETTLQRSLHARPPADPTYRPRLTGQPGVLAVPDPAPLTIRRTRPMLTATRLIAAAAMIAFISGALLFSAGGAPSPTPGASYPPTPTPGPSLVTEALAPGLERVIGMRDMSPAPAPWVFRLDSPGDTSMNHTGIGPDGTVWMVETGRLLRFDEFEEWSRDGVGRPDRPDWIPGFHDDIQIAADGTVFTNSWPIRSFDGTGWTTERDGYLFSGQADGAIWAYREDQLARWEDGRWTKWSVPGVFGGSPFPAVATTDGTVWLGRFDPGRAAEMGHIWSLARFDGAGLVDVTVPGLPDDASPTLIAAGPDGTLWVYLWSQPGTGYLARLTPGGWTVFGAEEGVPVVHDFYQGAPGFMAAGPDGRVWVTPQDEPGGDDCGGVASFDGTEWNAYLTDVCVVDLDVAPGGSVWVQTAVLEEGALPYKAGATYRITQG